MRTLKVLFSFLILLSLSLVIFYFYASSATLSGDDYYSVKKYSDNTSFNSDTLKIMTYNLGYLSGMTNNLAMDRSVDLYNSNLTRCKSFIEGMDADIVAFQEIDFDADRSFNFNQLDSLAVSDDFTHAAVAVNWDKSYLPFPYWPIRNHFGKVISGQAVLSKVQVLKQEVMVLDKPLNAPFYYNKFYLDRLVQITYLKMNTADTLIVMNVHLEAFDEPTNRAQVGVVKSILQTYITDYPVILVGDFNSRPPYETITEESINTLKELFLIEGIKEVISKNEYLANKSRFFTFDTANPYERLDYIFYTEDAIQMIDAGVARQAGNISDHLPVWMRFVIKKTNE